MRHRFKNSNLAIVWLIDTLAFRTDTQLQFLGLVFILFGVMFDSKDYVIYHMIEKH